MRDAALLRRPRDPAQQAAGILRGAVRSRRNASPTRGRVPRAQSAGDEGIHLSLATALPLPAGRI